MKKSIFGLFVASFFAATITTSCDNTQDVIDPSVSGETGNMEISFNFKSTPGTYADPDDYVVPTTYWSDIESLGVFMVDNSNVIVYANDITSMVNSVDNASNQSVTVSNIEEGSYTLYVLANYETSNTKAQGYGYGGVPQTSISPVSYVGKYLSTLVLDIASDSSFDYPLEEDPGYSYGAAPNYFLGTADNVTISSATTANVDVSLERIVSLVRVMINNSVDPASSTNADIDFTDSDASFMIRRINSTYDVSTGNYADDATNVETLYFKKGFLSADPTSGYASGSTYSSVLQTPYTTYQDALLFPGGADENDSSSQLNFVVTGICKVDGYECYGGLTADIGDMVAWAGNVKQALVVNNVMIVKLNLQTAGQLVDEDHPLPPAKTYGDMEVDIELIPWDELVEIEMTW